MILLKLNEHEAELIISVLLTKISSIETDNIILRSDIERLKQKLNCSEFPTRSESAAADNGGLLHL